jgi:hypothetical protein
VQFDGSVGADEEIWFGKVTSTGASTVTFKWSSSITGHTAEYGVQEFTAGLGTNTVWTLDTTGTLNNVSSSLAPFPPLEPSQPASLYFGYSALAYSSTGGSTAGFTTYKTTAENNVIAYDTNALGLVTPSTGQSPSGISSSIGIILNVST